MPRNAPRLAFAVDEYRQRLDRTRAWMDEQRLDVLMVTQPEHYNWLSGYEPTSIFYHQALVFAAGDRDPSLLCNRAELALYEETCWVDDLRPIWTYEDQVARTIELLADHGLRDGGRLGVNLSSYNLKPSFVLELQRALPATELVDISPGLDELRLVKSRAEVEYLREAAGIADAGVRAGAAAAHEGGTDNDVMAAIQQAVTLAGGQFPAYPGLVDARASLHGTNIGKELVAGDVLLLEVSGVARRYHCNEVRNVIIGEPDGRVRELYALVEQAHRDCLEILRPGTTSEQVVAFSQQALGEHGGENWGRFGFGMEIAYPPIWIGALSLMKGDQHVLEPGIVLTLETGILAEQGSLLLGTNVLVGEEGPEILNSVGFDLIVA